MAIKTSMVAFQGEQGCYIGIPVEGVGAPAANTKVVPVPWGAGIAPRPAPVTWCLAGGVTTALGFNDIGFRATGNVNYRYAVDATVLAGVGPAGTYSPTGAGGATDSCAAVRGAFPTGVGPVGANNFIAAATTNLDGDPTISSWASTVDHGAADCTPGSY